MILFNEQITKRGSGCADARVGLHFCCSQTPEDRFSRVEPIVLYPTVYFTLQCTLPYSLTDTREFSDDIHLRIGWTPSVILNAGPLDIFNSYYC